ncbi:MAG: hypothetical protein FWC69_04380 [Defluviitaleaceae bacterium]|nr:hypothetical protein [Defluviitaleaceae bacterium]
MGKKPKRPEPLRHVAGLIMLSLSIGMIFTWLFFSASFFLAVVLLILGFYFLFM